MPGLKPINTEKNPGLSKLPEDVRNKMGYMKEGGMAKKTKAQKKIGKVMGEFKEGKLKSSSGQKVTSKKQAVAIALSEAGKAKPKVRKFSSGGDNVSDTDRLNRDLQKTLLENSAKRVTDDSGLKFRVIGGGGSDKYGSGLGGRVSAEQRIGKDTSIEVYGEGYAAKPKGGKAQSELTGYGMRVRKEFKEGGMAKKMDKTDKKWIKEAIKKPGALRKTLKVKKGETISEKELAKAAKAPGKTGQRARLAQTLKKMK